jgi:hypothetical protein
VFFDTGQPRVEYFFEAVQALIEVVPQIIDASVDVRAEIGDARINIADAGIVEKKTGHNNRERPKERRETEEHGDEFRLHFQLSLYR